MRSSPSHLKHQQGVPASGMGAASPGASKRAGLSPVSLATAATAHCARPGEALEEADGTEPARGSLCKQQRYTERHQTPRGADATRSWQQLVAEKKSLRGRACAPDPPACRSLCPAAWQWSRSC